MTRLFATATIGSALALLAGVSGASSASAQREGDAVYGRLDADVTLEAGIGGGATFTGPDVSGAAVLDLRARYLDMGGVLLGGELRPEGVSRVLVGVDVRPLFIARFLLDASFHDRFWDLLVDSIGVDLGVGLAPLDESVGAALFVGFGLDVPLVFFDEGVGGLALRLFGRWMGAQANDRFGPSVAIDDWLAGATLVFRGSVSTGLPGWERPRYRLP